MDTVSNLAYVRADIYDFRNTCWGMTRSDVKISEKNYPLSENETHITYNSVHLDLEATIGFHFVNNSLIEAGYAFREYYPDPKLYINEYDRVKSELTNKYGQPQVENDSCKCCNQGSGCSAQFDGNQSKVYIVQWLTSRSTIRLLLASDEVSTEFGILHLSREHDNSSTTMQASVL